MDNCSIVKLIRTNNLEEFVKLVSSQKQCLCYLCKNNKIFDLIFQVKPEDYEKMFCCGVYYGLKAGHNTLGYACKLGNLKIVKYLVERNLCEPDLTGLVESIYYGNIDVMNYLSNECNVEIYKPKDRGLFFFHGVQRNFGEIFFDWLRERGHTFTLEDIEKAKDNFCFEDITKEQEQILIEYYKKHFEYEIFEN